MGVNSMYYDNNKNSNRESDSHGIRFGEEKLLCALRIPF